MRLWGTDTGRLCQCLWEKLQAVLAGRWCQHGDGHEGKTRRQAVIDSIEMNKVKVD